MKAFVKGIVVVGIICIIAVAFTKHTMLTRGYATVGGEMMLFPFTIIMYMLIEEHQRETKRRHSHK